MACLAQPKGEHIRKLTLSSDLILFATLRIVAPPYFALDAATPFTAAADGTP